MANELKKEYVEKIYAGWLAKNIGIRLGAPIEGQIYEEIRRKYGVITGYLEDYQDFAADDDSNGPVFFIRALEDKAGKDLCAQDVADALLNYAPYEHGFFWWGGYGISTEHTAYLNLYHGMKAPESGSMRQNGSTVAEQIGGQIFIDSWGLVNPNDPDTAAKEAALAASVTHDGNGVCGGIFVAVCISAAFEETDIQKLLDTGLSYIPEDCMYAEAVQAVRGFYGEHPEDFRECFDYIRREYGYDRFPGNCHIIPNAAVMVLSLLYGEGDFERTLCICNMCGWDTDCNVGNVAAIMGVRGGLEGIPFEKWRAPLHDMQVSSSVMGVYNLMDIPYWAGYMAGLAAAKRGLELPEPYRRAFRHGMESCHFEFPGSTHNFCVRQEKQLESVVRLINTDEASASGERSLKIVYEKAGYFRVYRKTYYKPEDFSDSRYDPCFSPQLYPGQTIYASVMGRGNVPVCPYVRDGWSGREYRGEAQELKAGGFTVLEMKLPPMENVCLEEAGLLVYGGEDRGELYLDEFYFEGVPAYILDMEQVREEVWSWQHRELSQFTRWKGLSRKEGREVHLSGADGAALLTGHPMWENGVWTVQLTPVTGDTHMSLFRVQGAMRYYAAALLPGGRAGILKRKGRQEEVLGTCTFEWEHGKEYTISVEMQANVFRLSLDGKERLTCEDREGTLQNGAVGAGIKGGGHLAIRRVEVVGK